MEGAQERQFIRAGIAPGSMASTPSFVKYKPTVACSLPEKVHPAKVVESSSLAAIKLPELSYRVSPSVLNCSNLSSLQIEAIALTGHTHTRFHNGRRSAMLIGDGAGVGKGRIISGVIKDNFEKGRTKSIWFSKTSSLIDDAARDFRAVGHDVKHLKRLDDVYNNGNISADDESCLFTSYAAFQRNGEKKVRALLAWLRKDFRGVVALDECHEIKNPKCKSSQVIQYLDQCMPIARVVYSSATISETIEGLKYLQRLNLWGPNTSYPNGFSEMEDALERIGIVGTELIAMELKKRGSYVARRLDFSEASFSVVKVPLTESQRLQYNECVALWNELYEHALQCKEKHIKRYFWGQHQQFFKLLCLSFKIPQVIENINTYLSEGKAVIVGIQSTGGFLSSKATQNTSKLLSTLEAKLINVVSRVVDPGERSYRFRQKVLNINLPPSPLDELVNKLGPKIVSELTGRTRRLEAIGENKYKWRTLVGKTNDRLSNFMNDKTKVAIISAACSTGISLHTSNDARNQRQRIHMTIELPWSAEQVIQQCGRSLRSGQRSMPIYELVVADVAGETRFAYGVSLRMSQLGAISQGDRTFTINSIGSFSMNSIYSQDVVSYTLKTISMEIKPLIRYKDMDMIKFFKELHYELLPVGLFVLKTPTVVTTNKPSTNGPQPFMRKATSVNTFLNRLLGVRLPQQNRIFKYFLDLYEHTIEHHKQAGCYEEGIIDCGKADDYKITKIKLHDGSIIEIFGVKIDCGISFERALEIYKSEDKCEFYSGTIGKHLYVYLAIPVPDSMKLSLLFPFGLLPTKSDSPIFSSDFIKHPYQLAKKIWDTNYAHEGCCHISSSLPCPHKAKGTYCGIGNRYKVRLIVTGLLWSNIKIVENLLLSCNIHTLQLVRCQVNLGTSRPNIVVGVEIPQECMYTFQQKIGKRCY